LIISDSFTAVLLQEATAIALLKFVARFIQTFRLGPLCTYSDIDYTFSDEVTKYFPQELGVRVTMKDGVVKRPRMESTVRIATIAALPAVLRSLGANPDQLLAEVGLDLKIFEDPDNRISFATRGRLFSHCIARTGCRHLGLLVGQQGGLHSFGLLGSLMKHAPDVGTALRGLLSYMQAHVRGAVTVLTVDNGTALFSYNVHEPKISAIDQIGDGAVAMMLKIMRELCGSDWKPIEAWFAHRRPEDIQPFRRHFGVPLRFDADQNALLFSARWLNKPLINTEPEFSQLLQQQIRHLEANSGDEFPQQVRNVLRTAIPAGHFSEGQVAALFSIHSRTLARRLTGFGTRFRTLVDEERFEIARQLLENTTLEVNQVATSLGYARASVFTRAFRRWSGATPASWRAKRADRCESASQTFPIARSAGTPTPIVRRRARARAGH
jgi:AraC-like DNA-binding protein